MAYLAVSFAFRCPHHGIMYSLDYHRCTLQPKSSAGLRMNSALKLIRNQSRWHFAPRRLMRRGTNIQIIQVIPTVQIVTNQDTGSADVGQKGVELKEKDRTKEGDRRKRRTTGRIWSRLAAGSGHDGADLPDDAGEIVEGLPRAKPG